MGGGVQPRTLEKIRSTAKKHKEERTSHALPRGTDVDKQKERSTEKGNESTKSSWGGNAEIGEKSENNGGKNRRRLLNGGHGRDSTSSKISRID